jgi:hypothetical protein
MDITSLENFAPILEADHDIKLFDWSCSNLELSMPDLQVFGTLTSDEKRLVRDILNMTRATPNSSSTRAGNMKLFLNKRLTPQVFSTTFLTCRPEIVTLVKGIIAHTTRVERGLATFDMESFPIGINPKIDAYIDYLIKNIEQAQDSSSKIYFPAGSDPKWVEKRYVDTYIQYLTQAIQSQTLKKRLANCKSSLKDYISKSDIWLYYDETYSTIWVQLKKLQNEHQINKESFDLDEAQSTITIFRARFNNNGNLSKTELEQMRTTLTNINPPQVDFRLIRVKKELINDIIYRLKSFKKSK